MDLPKRKSNRLENYDYNSAGAYFITVCTKNRQNLLCDIVGEGLCALPSIKLFPIGLVIKESIEYINKKYIGVSINKYVIMPNHIHLLVRMKNETGGHRDPPLQFHFKCDLQKQNRPFLRSVLIIHSELRIPH